MLAKLFETWYYISMTLPIENIHYLDLYKKWEKSQWSAYDIDFSQDREDWRKLTSEQKGAILWICSLFYAGEDEVTDTLAPFLKGLWTEEQRYMLTTQQVDEARHSIFFTLFFENVVSQEEDIQTVAELLNPAVQYAFSRPGFNSVFSYLRDITHQLDQKPSLKTMVQASTTYHLLVEATLAQQGQTFIQENVCQDMMPGLKQGLKNIEKDEHRHIAFGMRLLFDCLQKQPHLKQDVFKTIARLAPDLADVFEPPVEAYVTDFGTTQAEIVDKGLNSMQAKLRSIGIQEIPEWVIPVDLHDKEKRGEIIVNLNKAVRGLKENDVELISAVARAFHPKKVQSIKIRLENKIYYITYQQGKASVSLQKTYQPQLTWTITRKQLQDLASGQSSKALLKMKGNPLYIQDFITSSPLSEIFFEETLKRFKPRKLLAKVRK